MTNHNDMSLRGSYEDPVYTNMKCLISKQCPIIMNHGILIRYPWVPYLMRQYDRVLTYIKRIFPAASENDQNRIAKYIAGNFELDTWVDEVFRLRDEFWREYSSRLI